MSANSVKDPTFSAGPCSVPAASNFKIAVFCCLALVAGVCATRWFYAHKTSPLAGYLEVRTTYVNGNCNGRILRLLADEGASVSIGDPLIVFEDDQLEKSIQLVTHRIETLNSELRQAEALAELQTSGRMQEVDEKIYLVEMKTAEYVKDKFDLELRKTMLADVLTSHENAIWDMGDPVLQHLSTKQKWPNHDRMATIVEIEAIENRREIVEALVEISENRIDNLRHTKAGLPEQIARSCGVDVSKLQLEQARKELATLEANREQLTVKSTAVGNVGVFQRRVGDLIRQGDPLVELLDDSKRYIRVEVPSARITEFVPGKTIVLQFPGKVTREGRVTKVAPQAERRKQLYGEDSIVEVEVEQAGRLWPAVPIGSRVQVVSTDATAKE